MLRINTPTSIALQRRGSIYLQVESMYQLLRQYNVRVSGDVPNPDSVGLALQLSELAVEPGAT